jgi:hypothetical protein
MTIIAGAMFFSVKKGRYGKKPDTLYLSVGTNVYALYDGKDKQKRILVDCFKSDRDAEFDARQRMGYYQQKIPRKSPKEYMVIDNTIYHVRGNKTKIYMIYTSAKEAQDECEKLNR